MSHEEEKVLKELVSQSLAAKGFLGKIQAEIRAGVFVALEEQDVLKDIFINKPLKDFIETPSGLLVISLVREFLEFFNLQFTNMVFDPETHAGIDYKFEGRKKLATDLNLPSDQDENAPLLGLLLQSIDSIKENILKKNGQCSDTSNIDSNLKINNNECEEKELITIHNDSCSNDLGLLAQICSEKHSSILNNDFNTNDSVNKVEILDEKKANSPYELSSKNEQLLPEDNLSSKIGMKQLDELLQFEPDGGDVNYEEDFISSGSDKKEKSDSTESEIDEELPTNSNDDDVTADLTISNESGQGDYTERISNC